MEHRHWCSPRQVEVPRSTMQCSAVQCSAVQWDAADQSEHGNYRAALRARVISGQSNRAGTCAVVVCRRAQCHDAVQSVRVQREAVA